MILHNRLPLEVQRSKLGEHRDAPAVQVVDRLHQVGGRSPPAAEIGDEEPATLCVVGGADVRQKRAPRAIGAR